MEEGLLNTVNHLKDVLTWIGSACHHFLCFVLGFFICVFIEYKDMISAVVALSIVDWLLAVVYNFINKTIESKKLLKFIGKIIIYGIGFMTAYCFSTFLQIKAVEGLITMMMVLAELHSIITNASLIWPDSKLLKYFDKYIQSEIKNKKQTKTNAPIQ